MASYLDLEHWPRRQHFDFFRKFEMPFFNICANVDVSEALAYCQSAEGPSFSILTFYLSLRAANEVEPFKYRLRGDRVVIHDVIHGGSTALRDDDTFGFAYFAYDEDFSRFAGAARQALDATRTTRDLTPSSADDALIHYSVIPWLSFTSFAHARKLGLGDSVPKIVFGKYFEDRGRWLMPVSVEVHHALMDGLHVGKYFEVFEQHLKYPH